MEKIMLSILIIAIFVIICVPTFLLLKLKLGLSASKVLRLVDDNSGRSLELDPETLPPGSNMSPITPITPIPSKTVD